MVAFPLILPMGWVESPPYFFTVTETVADLRRATLDTIEQEVDKAWRSFGTILDMLRSYWQQVIWMSLPFGVCRLS